jgi:SNF2 family DNA or RNA helicase
MTGTPMTNQVDDLWTLLDFVTPGQWGTFAGFKARFCVMGGFNGKQVMAVKNSRQLNARLNQVMLRREIDSVIELPEINVVKRMVSLVDRPREMYNYLSTEHLLRKYVPTMTEEEEEGLEWPMVRALRMRQICSSTCTLLPTWDESPKLDLAIEDAVEILENGHKLIVFTQFRPIVTAYMRRLEAARPGTPVYEIHGSVDKDKRVGVVKKWSEEEGPAVCIGIIKAMGVGLNMTAANHCQFIDREFSPALNDQAVGRLRRVGSEHHPSIQVLEYMVRNSMENRVEVIVQEKKHSFDEVIRGAATNSETQSFMDKIAEALEGTL